MFIKDAKSGYTRDGQQKASGQFLIVFDEPGYKGLRPPLRACVRKVHLKQLGHFMMGQVRLAGFNIVLSGTYGGDGLPVSLDLEDLPRKVVEHIWHKATPLPKKLQAEFWEGGGHNDAGKEATAMRDWALENLKDLKRPIQHINNYLAGK